MRWFLLGDCMWFELWNSGDSDVHTSRWAEEFEEVLRWFLCFLRKWWNYLAIWLEKIDSRKNKLGHSVSRFFGLKSLRLAILRKRSPSRACKRCILFLKVEGRESRHRAKSPRTYTKELVLKCLRKLWIQNRRGYLVVFDIQNLGIRHIFFEVDKSNSSLLYPVQIFFCTDSKQLETNFNPAE